MSQQTPSKGTDYYLTDGAGSVVGLTDSSGTLVAQASYDPKGNTVSQSGTEVLWANGYGATKDADSGMYSNGSSLYDPSTASSNQGDPPSLSQTLWGGIARAENDVQLQGVPYCPAGWTTIGPPSEPHDFEGDDAYLVARLCGRVTAPYYFELGVAIYSNVLILSFWFSTQIAQVGVENETAQEGPIFFTECAQTGEDRYFCENDEQQAGVNECDVSYYVYAEGDAIYDFRGNRGYSGALDLGSRAGEGFISVPCGNEE